MCVTFVLIICVPLWDQTKYTDYTVSVSVGGFNLCVCVCIVWRCEGVGIDGLHGFYGF